MDNEEMNIDAIVERIRKGRKENKIISQIYAITSRCLICGYLPTEKEELMMIFKDIDATKEDIIKLAKCNKLRWLRTTDTVLGEQDYNKAMSKSLAHYLSQ